MAKPIRGPAVNKQQTIAQIFPWTDYRTFVDIGTAQGDLAVQIATVNPHLHGTGFDLPEIGPVFEEYVATMGVDDRLKFQTSNFNKRDLPNAEVVLMGHILHDWDLPTKRMLIGKGYDALRDGGALGVYEAIVDDEPQYAYRNARRIRLYGCRLCFMAEGSGILHNTYGTPGRPRLDGYWYQITVDTGSGRQP